MIIICLGIFLQFFFFFCYLAPLDDCFEVIFVVVAFIFWMDFIGVGVWGFFLSFLLATDVNEIRPTSTLIADFYVY